MSDFSIPVAYRGLHAPAKTAAIGRNPVGLWATLACVAAGILTIHFIYLTGLKLSPIFMPLVYIPVVAMVAATVWLSGRSFREYLALQPLSGRDVGRGIGYGLLGFLGMVIVSVLATILQAALGGTVSSGGGLGIGKLTFDAEDIVFLFAVWAALVVAAPIGEEILFRGLCYRGLESRFGALVAVLVSSIVFGLMHFPGFGWTRVAGTTAVGLLLGWLRWRTGNTSVGIVSHATVNFVAALVLTTMMLVPSLV